MLQMKLCASQYVIDYGVMSGKLFLIDQNIIGMVVSNDMTIKIFNYDPIKSALKEISKGADAFIAFE
jgi:hypothetical protein